MKEIVRPGKFGNVLNAFHVILQLPFYIVLVRTLVLPYAKG